MLNWIKLIFEIEIFDILLFDGFLNLCFVNMIELLRVVNMILVKLLYYWWILMLLGELVISLSGLCVMLDVYFGW